MTRGHHGLRRTPEGTCLPGPAPAAEVDAETFTCTGDGIVPNDPDLPVVMMSGVILAGAAPDAILALPETNGRRRVRHLTVLDGQHDHPDAPEGPGVASGCADLQLGGSAGEIRRATVGDAIVLPAGTGHCRIDAADHFAVCGGYQPGRESRTILRGIAASREDDMPARIAALPRPGTDPIYGPSEPLCDAWA